MATDVDVVQQLADAVARREQLAGSLPELTRQTEHAAAERVGIAERLERAEGDALIGRVSDSALASLRAKNEAAVLADRKAIATLRHSQREVTRLDDAIARLTPEVQAVRVAYYQERQKAMASQLLAGLEALRELNESLHQNYVDAYTEFPALSVRGGGQPYSTAAGVTDLSWYELRHNPHAMQGGRFGAWSQSVEDFLNPPAPVPPRRARSAAMSPTDSAVGTRNPWRPLPQEELR